MSDAHPGNNEHRMGARPALARLVDDLRSRNLSAAVATAKAAATEYVLPHDGMRNMTAYLHDGVYRSVDRALADHICETAYEQMTTWTLREPSEHSMREQIEAVAIGWHWHRTPFDVSEDDTRVSFRLSPCGSGGRMVNQGMFLPSHARRLTVLDDPSHVTFGEESFPSWCGHCALSNRAHLRRGLPFYILEGWSPNRRWGGCSASSYKDMSAIPAEVFERVGLPAQQTIRQANRGRLFSDAELVQLSVHPIDRIQQAITVDDLDTAIRLAQASLAAWTGLHDAYRAWFYLLYRQIADQVSPAIADDCLKIAAWEVVAPLLERASRPTADDWRSYWCGHGGCTTSPDQPSTFAIDHELLVHPDERGQVSTEFAEKLAEAVTRGTHDHGYARDFGGLVSDADGFLHVAGAA